MVSASAFQVDDLSSILSTYNFNFMNNHFVFRDTSDTIRTSFIISLNGVIKFASNFRKHLIMVHTDCYLGD